MLTKKKIYNWELWDWNTIRNYFFIIFFLLIAYLGISKLKEHLDENRYNKLSGQVEGEYQYMNAVKRMSNTLSGGTTTPANYFEVKYFYFVKGQPYFATGIIFNNTNNATFINRLIRGENKKLHIRYNPIQPAESEIIVD